MSQLLRTMACGLPSLRKEGRRRSGVYRAVIYHQRAFIASDCNVPFTIATRSALPDCPARTAIDGHSGEQICCLDGHGWCHVCCLELGGHRMTVAIKFKPREKCLSLRKCQWGGSYILILRAFTLLFGTWQSLYTVQATDPFGKTNSGWISFTPNGFLMCYVISYCLPFIYQAHYVFQTEIIENSMK